MQKILGYLLIFGFPILAYWVWLAWPSKRMHFFLLLAAIVVAIWMLLWPLHYATAHWDAVVDESTGDAADAVLNGFVLFGWLYGVVGCLPIILIEIARSVILLMRKRKCG